MSTRLQHKMDKKAPAQRLSSLSPVALVVMGLVGAADALAAVRETLVQNHAAKDNLEVAKTTVMDYNAVASLVQALVREGLAPEEAALQVQFALQGPNPLAALSALVVSVATPTDVATAQDALSLSSLVEALTEQVAQIGESGQALDMSLVQDVVPQSAGFAQADLAQALETFKALEQGTGSAARGGNAEVAQNQIDLLLAQATQAGAAVATDAGAATAATASGAATGAAAAGALSAAQAIALVGFAAVAGGAFSSSDPSLSGISLSGFVLKGPVDGAKVYLDVNGNLILDGDEAQTLATTDASGAYTLPNLSKFNLTSSSKVVAYEGTDTVTGKTLGTLVAPTSAKVVTPLTTLLAANSNLSSADLKAVLGLSYDPLTFNPFASGVSNADKLAAEGVALQVNTLLNSLSGAVAAAPGLTLTDAFKSVASKLGDSLLSLKGTASAGNASLLSDSSSALITDLVGDLRSLYSSVAANITSSASSAAAANNTIKSAILTAIQSGASLDTSLKNSLSGALGAAPVAHPTLLPDKSVAEDAALSGSGGTGSLTTLPSTFTATNIDRANLLKFFDNDSSTVGNAPTLTFDMTGYSVADSGTSTLDLVVSLQKTAFAGRDLTVTLNDVKLDAVTASGKTTLTLPAQTISATVKMGSVSLGTFTFSNLDSDALTLTSGSNTVGTSPAFSLKLDSLFAKMTNGVGDVLDLKTLSNKALVALGGALVVGTLDDLSPATVVAKLKSLIALPSSVDSVAELVTLAKNVVDFPEVSSLKISDLLGQIPDGSTKTLLLAAASRANVDVTVAHSDTVSSALTKFSTAFGTYKLSDLSSLLSNGLGLDQGVNLVSVAKELVVAALNKAEGLTAEQILDKAIGALIDANNGDLRALLAGVDYQSIVGNQIDTLNLLNNIVQHGTVKYVDLINLGAHTLLSSDATLVVQATDFNYLAVTSGGAAQTSLQVSVPIGSASTFTPPSNGLAIPAGAFTDADTADDLLKYTATLANGAALPSWLKFDASTKSFTGTPLNDDVGDLNIKITAIDPAGNTATHVFKLTVTPVNDAPQVVSGATTTASAVEFGTATFDVSKAFKDVDAGDVLTYSAASVTGDIKSSDFSWSSAGVLSVKAPINNSQANATQPIKITATDKAGASVTQDFTLTVTNDTLAPVKLSAALERDNGAASNDGITSNGTINITGLETGATWEYSLNNGARWDLGSGTSFVVPVGTYATQYVQVRQTDQAGNPSEVTKYSGSLDIRTAPVTPSVALATPDSGTPADGITNSGIVNVGQLLSTTGSSWQYSINNGSTWSTGSGTSFTLADGVYAANQIQVRQSDGNFESLYGKIATAVTIDSAKPAMTVGAPTLANGVFTYTFTSTEALTGFELADITVTGGTKGSTLTTSDNKTFTLDVTPTAASSATAPAADLTVAVATTAATDAAGNSLSVALTPVNSVLAASLANSVLFGTSANQTITGTTAADTISGGGGADVINGNEGNDFILGGSGNDTITGGAGADKIDLSAGGSDVLKIAAATDSPSTGADSVTGFAAGDKIDLSAILGSLGIGYTGENSVPAGSADSPFTLIAKPISNGVASVDVIYNGNAILGEASLDIDFLMPTGVTAMTVPNKASGWLIDSYVSTGVIAGVVVDESSVTVLAKGATFATINFAVPTTTTSFIFAVESVKVNDVAVLPPQTKLIGTTSTAQSGYYTIVDDGTTLGTVGDNEIHFANNPTTKTVDIRYDTNKAANATSASDIIHLDGVTGIDLTKTDFVFV